MKALLQEPLSSGKVRCNVCAFNCELSEGQTGVCRVRRNEGGEIRYHAYEQMGAVCPFVGNCAAGSYCVSKPSCNWSCSFCLAADTTLPDMQQAIEGDAAIPLTHDGFMDKKAIRGPKLNVIPLQSFKQKTPAEVVEDWKASGKPFLGMRTSEPSIHLESVRDIFSGVKEAGGSVVINTNGYWTSETVEVLGPLVDVVEVGVKGSANPTFMRKVCGVPKTEPIFDTIKGLVAQGRQVLVSDIPVWHRDFESDMDRLCSFIAEEIPAREYPRFSIAPFQGHVPAVAFGHFKAGMPWAFGRGAFVDSRAALLVASVKLALEHLDSIWLQGLAYVPDFEREWLDSNIGFPSVAEGWSIRAARSEADLGEVLELEKAEPSTDLVENINREWSGLDPNDVRSFLEERAL